MVPSLSASAVLMLYSYCCRTVPQRTRKPVPWMSGCSNWDFLHVPPLITQPIVPILPSVVTSGTLLHSSNTNPLFTISTLIIVMSDCPWNQEISILGSSSPSCKTSSQLGLLTICTSPWRDVFLTAQESDRKGREQRENSIELQPPLPPQKQRLIYLVGVCVCENELFLI